MDRVELKFGRTTRGGALDMAAMATVTRDELAGMVDEVRTVRDDVEIGLFLLIAVGDNPEVEATAEALGDNLCGGFAGEPAKVLDNLRSAGRGRHQPHPGHRAGEGLDGGARYGARRLRQPHPTCTSTATT